MPHDAREEATAAGDLVEPTACVWLGEGGREGGENGSKGEWRGWKGEGVYMWGMAGHVTVCPPVAGMSAQCGGLAEDTASTLPGAESAGERESTEVQYIHVKL